VGSNPTLSARRGALRAFLVFIAPLQTRATAKKGKASGRERSRAPFLVVCRGNLERGLIHLYYQSL